MLTSSIKVRCGLFCVIAFGVLGSACTAFSEEESAGGTNDAPVVIPPEKRDPFWPIGFVPKETIVIPKKEAPKVERRSGKYEWSAAMKMLSISGVSSKGKNEFFAVVNGKVKSVGDTISVDYQGITYTWAVESIKPPGSVKLRRVSAL